MANVYQKAAKRRKVTYLASIAALLALSLVVRGTFLDIGKRDVDQIRADPVASLTLDGRAKVHELTELQTGDSDLGGAAIQLMLVGSRGLAVCGLWMNAQEAQKKQEWNELDVTVNSITKIQPHFAAPWLFQSWNLAYNVSVEMDRLNDLYFYIARGINILAVGESLNRNNPDLRYNVGFMFQNKFSVHDRVTTLRCLYQLSCIPEEDRNPESLRATDGSVDPEKFERFCRDHPNLVRRLKEVRIPIDGDESKAQPLARSPEAVVAFLKANYRVPSRFKPGTKDLKGRLDQFPVLADCANNPRVTTQELGHNDPFGDHQQDGFLAARGWFSLANAAIPPPNPDPSGRGTDNPDPLKYRVPKRPSTIIFRQYPMLAQTNYAERLAKEGWFDNNEGWAIDEFADRSQQWIPAADRSTTARIASPASSQDAWQEAFRRWHEHGEANGLRISADQLAAHFYAAKEFCRRYPGLDVFQQTPPPNTVDQSDPELRRQYRSLATINGWAANRSMTNFETFYVEADAMRSADAMLARKRMFQADRVVREVLDYKRAVRLYQEGFDAWKNVLLAKQDCRAVRSSDPGLAAQPCRDLRDVRKYQEDMFRQNLKYATLLQDVNKTSLQSATLWLNDVVSMAGPAALGNPYRFATSLNALAGRQDIAAQGSSPARVEVRAPQLATVKAMPLPGPLDGVGPDGFAWIPEEAKNDILEKIGQKSSGRPNPSLPQPKGPPPLPGRQGPNAARD